MNLFIVISIILNVWSIYLAIKNSKWNWIINIAASVALFYYFWQAELLGQSLVQIAFVLQSIYGFIVWNKPEKKITRISFTPINNVVWGFSILTALVLYNFFKGIALFDYLLALMSFVAIYHMIRREVGCWLWWIMIDVLSIFLFNSIGMTWMAVLYGLFLIMAFWGYLTWSHILTNQLFNKYKDFYNGKQ